MSPTFNTFSHLVEVSVFKHKAASIGQVIMYDDRRISVIGPVMKIFFFFNIYERAVEHIVELLVIWDAIMPIVTALI